MNIKNNKIIIKIKFIFKEEGLPILMKRVISYLIFIFKINFMNKYNDIEKWNFIKDIYEGERIFLIGNGPSLNKTPLYLLKNEYTICFNRFFLMFERLNWFPTMYACIDDRVLKNIITEIEEHLNKFKYVFLPSIHPSSGENLYKLIPNENNIFWLILNKFSYSVNMPYAGMNKTVANVALQILSYMGFKKIYLIGVDMNYVDHKSVIKENKRDWTSTEDDDPNHFDPRYFGKTTKYHTPRMEETLLKYKEAKEFFDRIGVKIYNATVGGKLEIFPRVNFNDLFEIEEEKELSIFLKSCGIEGEFKSIESAFLNAIYVNTEDEWDNSLDAIIVNKNLGIKLINKVIFTHIPHGPFKGKYIFIKRNQNPPKEVK